MVALTPVPVSLAWERYVDELAKKQNWIELMAMRSGLGEELYARKGRAVGAVAH